MFRKALYLLVIVTGGLGASAQTPESPTAITLQPVLSALSSPVFVTSARDNRDRLFIVQQGGTIRVKQPGASTTTEFLNITNRVLFGGERGLLGLAFHPLYNRNRRFFVYYTRNEPTGNPLRGAIQIAEYRASAANPDVADLSTEKIILTIPHATNTNHNGGTVAFGPKGYLFIGTGDGGSANDPPNNAQNINSLLGKMLRIDINNVAPTQVPPYNIPPDNPYAGATAGADEIFAIGLRNPYRFSFDRRAPDPAVRSKWNPGPLWVGDVGQNSWEEASIVTLGGNYGWRIYEANHCTNIDGCTLPPNYVAPVFEYSSASPSSRCTIIGGYVYRGTAGTFPAGSYIYGDYCTGEILMWNNNQQTLLLDGNFSITGFGEDESGEIYVVTEGASAGTVQKIVGTAPRTEKPARSGERIRIRQ